MMITKEKISDYFIELLKVLEIKILPGYPDPIYIYKDKIYIEYDKKNNIMWLDDDKIWSVFKSKYSSNYQKIKELISGLVEEHLKLKGVTINKCNLQQLESLISNKINKK